MLQAALGYMGETSEIVTRLALREKTIDNRSKEFMKRWGVKPTGQSLLDIQREGTWVARNYLDFAQGGSLTKAADSIIPYLGAGIQGTRGIFRAMTPEPGSKGFKKAKRPAETAWKISQVMAIAAALYMVNRENPEYKNVSKNDKRNNFNVMLPSSFDYKDKEGVNKSRYVKIAKDQGQRGFAYLAENMMAKYLGDEVDVDGVTDTAMNLIPIIPTEVVMPTVEMFLGYALNKDFWTREDIWRGNPDIEPDYEVDNFTHPFFTKEIVEDGRPVTKSIFPGLSPKRVQTG